MGAPFWEAVVLFVKVVIGFSAAPSAAYFVAVTIARIGLLALAAKLTQPKVDLTASATEKLLTKRSTIAPQIFGYGEDMVSGPLLYTNVAGDDNKDLYFAIALIGHEVDSAVSYRIDDSNIPFAQIAGNGDSGVINGGDFNGVAEVEFHHGTSPQTASALLTGAFPLLFNAAHRGNDWAYMVWKFSLVEGLEDAFEKGAPQNMRVVLRLKKIYDPRLDTTNGGTGPHRLADVTTWEWSDNPALILADFIRDDRFGMKEDDARVDWPLVITAADICEVLVPIPTAATQKRYTFNGVFSSTDQRGNVRNEILSSMLGRMVFSQGLWKMWAGAAVTADVTLTEANLAGQIQLQASAGAKERYNRVRGKFIDPARNYTANSYPEQRSSVFVAEDGGEVRDKVADFTSSNTSFEAQRKAIITLKQSRNQRVVTFSGNYSCFRIQAGLTVLLDIAEYGFSGEKFFVTEWVLTSNGIDLTMVQEVDSVWNDPLEGDYTVRVGTGALVFGETGVPPVTGASATPTTGGMLLQWTNPPADLYDVIEVWGSDDNVRGNAVLIATVAGVEYLDQVSDTRVRFYWLRVRTSLNQVSTYEPDLTTTTLTGSAIIGLGVNVVPDFTPGLIGGSSDFVYTLNADLGGANVGEIKIDGDTFEHPDGTTITTDANPFAINTVYEGTTAGRFYIMFSAIIAETRFGGVAGDWGAGDDTRFITVTHDSINLWRARNNSGTFFAFTPIATDCIIAVLNKVSTAGGSGIEAIAPTTGGLIGATGATGGPGGQGDPGIDGFNTATLTAYKRAAIAPTDDPGNVTYTFATAAWTPANGWTKEIPAGADPAYAVSASAFSQSATDDILAAEWSSPVKIVEDGADGATGGQGDPGTDAQLARTVNIFRLNSSAINSTSGTFADPLAGNASWSFSVPALGSDGDVVNVAVRTFTDDAASPQDANWSTPTIYSQRTDGTDGGTGATGQRARTVLLFRLNNSSINSTAGTFADPLAGNASWSFSVPALGIDGDIVYTSTRTFTDDAASPQDANWATPTIYSQRTDGADGATGGQGDPGVDGGDGLNVATAFIYQRTNLDAAPTVPSVNATYFFADGNITGLNNGWTDTIPAASAGPFLWASIATASNVGSSDVIAPGEWAGAEKLSESAIGAPGFSTSYTYDDLDTTQLAAGASRYAMLTARLTTTSGDQNDFQNTDAILINIADKASLNDLDAYYTSLLVGDRITYWISIGRWYLYEIDAILASVGTGAAKAHRFGVTLIDFNEDSNSNIQATSGFDVKFQFNRGETGNFVDVKFQRSATVPATPTGDNPAGWTDDIPAGSDAIYQISGTKTFGGVLIGLWSAPIRIQGLIFRGAYSAATAYLPDDVVAFQERSYICVLATTGNDPSGANSGNTWWDLLAGKGDSGDPASPFSSTIVVTGPGPVNLRTLADADGYPGIGDATITFTIANGVTITGNANGGDGLDTGTWPAGFTHALTLENDGIIRGGGGRGGGGGAGPNAGGGNGGAGGDAINAQHDLTVDNAPAGPGLIQASGGGGGGGGGDLDGSPEPIDLGGGGGGGGFPNGSGGAGGQVLGSGDGTAGNPGTTGGGGSGGSGANAAGNGGFGGNVNTNGGAGTNATGANPGSGGGTGTRGFAVRRNGFSVPVTGGTVTGQQG